MSNDVIKVKSEGVEHPMDSHKEFHGYSIEELRYQRALIALRKDFCVSKMLTDAEKIKNRGIFGKSGDKSRGPKIGGIASKLISGLSYLDYAMIGMSVFGTGKKIFKFFRGRK